MHLILTTNSMPKSIKKNNMLTNVKVSDIIDEAKSKIKNGEMINDEFIIKVNANAYPDPEYITQHQAFELYPELNRNADKVAKWAKTGRVRTRPADYVQIGKAPRLYNPTNPAHKGKNIIKGFLYASEDFDLNIQADKIRKANPVAYTSMVKKIKSEVKGETSKWLVRDVRKSDPSGQELDILSDIMQSEALRRLTREKLAIKVKKYPAEVEKALLELLDEAMQGESIDEK